MRSSLSPTPNSPNDKERKKVEKQMEKENKEKAEKEKKDEKKRIKEEEKRLKDIKKGKRAESLTNLAPQVIYDKDVDDSSITQSQEEVDMMFEEMLNEMMAGPSVIETEMKKSKKAKWIAIQNYKKLQSKLNEEEEEEHPASVIERLKLLNYDLKLLQKLAIQLRTGPIQWANQFIINNGSACLSEALASTNMIKSKSKEDLYKQAEVVHAIKAILDTPTGMGSFLDDKESVRNLALILDTPNINTRREVTFILAIICNWSPEGYALCIDGINHFRLVKREAKRFQSVVNWLKDERDEAYKTVLIMLLNSLLSSAPEEGIRFVLKKEFRQIGLVPLIESLRGDPSTERFRSGSLSTPSALSTTPRSGSESTPRSEHSGSIVTSEMGGSASGSTSPSYEDDQDETIKDYLVQIDVFLDWMNDSSDHEHHTSRVNVTDPTEIAKVLKVQLSGTKSYHHYMNVLLNLLTYSGYGLDRLTNQSMDQGWSDLEKIVHRSINLQSGTVDMVSKKEIQLEDRVKMQQQQISDLEDKMRNSVNTIDEKTQSFIEELNRELKQSRTDLEHSNASLESLTNQRSQTEKSLLESTQKIQSLETKLSELTAKNETLSKSSENDARIKTLTSEIEMLKKSNATADSSQLKKEITKLEDVVKEKTKKIKDLQDELKKALERPPVVSTSAPPGPAPAPVVIGGGPPPPPAGGGFGGPPPPPPPAGGGFGGPPPPPPPPGGEGFGGPPPPPPPPMGGGFGGPPPPPPPMGGGGFGGPPPPPPPPGGGGFGGPPPPPPPMGGGGFGGPPPPPPPMGGGGFGGPPPPPPPGFGGPPPPPGFGGPPPPPGFGGPPPPPGMGGGMMAGGLPTLPTSKPKEPTRNFHFESIMKKDLNASIFISGGIAAKSHSIIKTLDLTHLEQLFTTKKNEPKVDPNAAPKAEKKELITLIDGKRSYGVSLQLGSLRGLTYAQVRQAIISMDETMINDNNISTLKQIAPTQEELDTVMAYDGPDPDSDLAEPDKFFRVMNGINDLPNRLEAWNFKMRFMSLISKIRPDMECLTQAAKQLSNSEKFKTLLSIVLTVGNFLNAQNARKVVHGFKLKSLSKLGDTKSSDGKSSLLQFIVSFVQDKHDSVSEFYKDLDHVNPSTRVLITGLEEDVNECKKGLELVKKQIKLAEEAALEGDQFKTIMQPFYEKSMDAIATVDEKWSDMLKELEKTAVLFNEDKKDMLKEPDKFFKSVDEFIILFQKAAEKNDQQKKLEEKRLKQEEEKLKKEKLKEEGKKAGASSAITARKTAAKDKTDALVGRGVLDEKAKNLKNGTALRKKRTNGPGDLDGGEAIDSNALNSAFSKFK